MVLFAIASGGAAYLIPTRPPSDIKFRLDLAGAIPANTTSVITDTGQTVTLTSATTTRVWSTLDSDRGHVLTNYSATDTSTITDSVKFNLYRNVSNEPIAADPAQSFTYTFWGKWDSSGGLNGEFFAVRPSDNTQPIPSLSLRVTAASLNARYRLVVGTGIDNVKDFPTDGTSYTIFGGKWRFCAVTYDVISTTPTVEIAVSLHVRDEHLVVPTDRIGSSTGAVATITDTVLASMHTHFLFKSPVYETRYLYGQIDDFRVYERVLSFTEISDIYNTTKPPPPP